MAENEEGSGNRNKLGEILGPCVFVTVGSTTFRELTHTVLSEKFVKTLVQCGFSQLVVQAGKGGQNIPLPKVPDSFDIVVYEYKPSLTEDLQKASLVISHGGAGCISESLGLKKPLIVVINDKLMDNHQRELADQLSEEGYLLSTSPSELLSTVEAYKPSQVKRYEPGDPAKFGVHIDRLMNYKSKTT